MKYIKKYHNVIHILLVICALVIIGLRIKDMRRPKSIEIERKSVVDEKVPTISDEPTIDFEKLRKKYNNKNIKGAIRIGSDKFEEVVFQTKDNTYYLKHNYRGKKTNGEIFIDYRLDIDKSDIKVIYAEGSSKGEIIEIETDKLVYKYEVVSLIEKKITHVDFNINDVIKNSLYVYNDNLEDVKEYLIVVNKKNNKYYSIICKKVK